jgi:hypothetical protein
MEIEQFIDFLIYKTNIPGEKIADAMLKSFNDKKHRKIYDILIDDKVITRKELDRYLKEFKEISVSGVREKEN